VSGTGSTTCPALTTPVQDRKKHNSTDFELFMRISNVAEIRDRGTPEGRAGGRVAFATSASDATLVETRLVVKRIISVGAICDADSRVQLTGCARRYPRMDSAVESEIDRVARRSGQDRLRSIRP